MLYFSSYVQYSSTVGLTVKKKGRCSFFFSVKKSLRRTAERTSNDSYCTVERLIFYKSVLPRMIGTVLFLQLN